MREPVILVCGAGSIGRRHIANLKALGASVQAWRARPEKAAELADEFAIPVHTDLETALGACDAVVVATESSRHLPLLLSAAARGRHLFIEKPVSHTLDGMAELRNAVGSLVVEVGCQLRACPVLQQLRSRLADNVYGKPLTYRAVMGLRLDMWRPGVDYRTSYSADRSRGGGAMMDLIHQVDLVRYMFGRITQVYCACSNVGPLDIAADDLSCLTLTSEGGLIGQVQLDMVSPVYRGDLEIVTTEAVINWSVTTSEVRIAWRGGDTERHLPANGFQRNDLFLAHMRHFLGRLGGSGASPLCALDDGIADLAVVSTAYQSDKFGSRCDVMSDSALSDPLS